MTEIESHQTFIETAGLERSGKSGRKSSVERLLEESLNTNEDNHIQITPPFPQENMTNGLDTSHQVGVKTTPERPQHLKSDQFIQDAGLSRTGRVARKSSMERLLEDQLQTWEPEDEPVFPSSPLTNGTSSDHYPLIRAQTIGASPISPSSTNADDKRRRFSSSSSVDESGQPKPRSGRKSSIYEIKQIEAPTATVGNRIASRTQHLFKQYEKDMSSHEVKPLEIDAGETSRNRRCSYERATSVDDKSKVDIARKEKAKELEEMKRAYQQRLLAEENEQMQERLRQRENQDLKYSHQLGSVKDRYLAVAKGETTQTADSDDEVDNTLVDKNGEKIERSGGKVEVVKSSDGVGNIRARFGSIGKSSWKKQGEEDDTTSVDTKSVNSARNLFKNLNQKKGDDQKSFNRPTTRKVKDPKELMEMRKKVTYGEDEEIPEDGVVKKSVIIEKDEFSNVYRKEALNKYEELEKNAKLTEFQPVNKPINRLMSDDDAKYELSRRSDSLSGSETGEVMIDTSGDVSGYEGSVSPCSPTSELSDDYISDTPKEEEKVPENTNDDGFESFQKGVVADGE